MAFLYENGKTTPLSKKVSVINRVPVVKIQAVKEREVHYEKGKTLTDPKAAVKLLRQVFDQPDREMTAVVSVDSDYMPIQAEITAVGGLVSCSVDIRNLFKSAILANAYGILLAHNHPGHVTEPSKEDIRLTEAVLKACEILDIKLLDHIIIGDGDAYFSFSRKGLLQSKNKEKRR